MSKMICAYMDFDCPTGFGFVAHKVMDMLTPWFKRNDIKVHVVALNYGDKPHRDYNEQISIINAREFARNMDDFYWRDALLKILQIGDYDLFWAMNDIPVLSPMTMHLAHLNEMKEFNGKKTFKTMLYTPIDSLPYQRYFKNLEKWDKLITYTEYGKNAMVDAFRQVGYTKKLDIGIIPHGLDADNFKPLKNKEELRVKYNLPTDAVIFGNINKNQPRKDLGTTLLAFKRYKNWYEQNKSELVGMGLPEKCVLYMHCYHSDKSGVRMHVLLERLNLIAQEDVYFPIDERYEAGKYTSKDMNEIYNCLDVFVNTTMAEGWGLSVTEAMSVGLPIVCPVHTSLHEITDDGKLVYAVADLWEHVQITDAENVRFKSNPEEVFNKMVAATLDMPKKINYLNRYKPKMEQYNWEEIADKFKTEIKKLIL
jgi:glycosyltransferase involved in cell wall biosynthesis